MFERENLELICFLHEGWEPLIRPASAKREWMSKTPESFAYRCLPMDIANEHGWEILTPTSFDARWNGGSGPNAIEIQFVEAEPSHTAPCSIFGQGVLTFHIPAIFRTPSGWNLWVGGIPNSPKDGIYPLTGMVETDWSPFTFTMNWKFTRPGHWVRFDAEEPICFIFPLPRGYLDDFIPKIEPLTANPDLLEAFQSWSDSRRSFHELMEERRNRRPTDAWQKDYFRGKDAGEKIVATNHQTRLDVKPFHLGDELC